MTVVGIIGVDNVVVEHVFMFFINKLGYKGLTLVDCERDCYTEEGAPNKFAPSAKTIDNESNTERNEREPVTKRVCFCGCDIGDTYECWVKFRARKAFMVTTSDWNSNYIISKLSKEFELDIFSNTFFVSLAIDIPSISRFSMLMNKYENNDQIYHEKTVDMLTDNPDNVKVLLSLLINELNESRDGTSRLLRKSDYYIGYFKDFCDLENKILGLKLSDMDLRPSWDEYFMKIAKIASQRSNCISRKVGSVIVKDKKILSTGYNGTPKNMNNCFEGGCARCTNPDRVEGKSLETCSCMHAEANAMLFAGIEKCNGATIYITLMPCISCTKSIIQCEIERVVYSAEYTIPENISTIKLLRDSNIKVDRFIERQYCL
ncbi:Dcd1p-like dCMP deaminase [Cryptosporidium canis]|uniref:dCMP deaminase n=1 Tax=Cryptosporidium canis TaxID=195482 RepID=A0ABQ8P6X5_9CRYT|nr:Dcd1p-like dCMP deaminase [Cryptosporidium canis]KAJ1612144.1 Dcd1p-like dCMP deaminase [Cryptosporidium canis]